MLFSEKSHQPSAVSHQQVAVGPLAFLAFGDRSLAVSH
jgi:hypothetical protein